MTDYTPDTLRSMATQVRELRMLMLTDISDAGADPFSEEYFLLALASLDSAHRFLTLASMAQARGIAGARR